MMKKIINLTGMALVVATLFSACKKDDTPPPIPVLTPEESFSMDFSDFQNEKSAPLLIENWLYSVANITFFNTIVSANMAIPTIAFTASFSEEPTYIGDQTWQWSYEFIGIGATYRAKLNGITGKKNVKWEMYIDKLGSNSFADFLWFEGTTTDSTSAEWKVYKNPSAPTELFNIEWSANAPHTESSLKYTYLDSGSARKNSTIEFEKKPGETFNRHYSIYFSDDNSDINIEWNSNYKNGRVMSPNYYKDNSWHCWNQYLFDDWCD